MSRSEELREAIEEVAWEIWHDGMNKKNLYVPERVTQLLRLLKDHGLVFEVEEEWPLLPTPYLANSIARAYRGVAIRANFRPIQEIEVRKNPFTGGAGANPVEERDERIRQDCGRRD